MIKASKLLREYISSQEDKDELSKRFEISRRTLSDIEKGDQIGHADIIGNILLETGLEFDKAFEVQK